MNSLRVEQPEGLGKRNAMTAFDAVHILSIEEIDPEKKKAAMDLASTMFGYFLKLRKVEGKLEAPIKQAELENLRNSIKLDTGKIKDSELEAYTNRFLDDIKNGKNPFRSDYIHSMEALMLEKYHHSTYTVKEPFFSGLAEVVHENRMERSKKIFTVREIELTARSPDCPTSHFYILQKEAKNRMFIDLIFNPAEDKRTVETILHLRDVAFGGNPDSRKIFGHNGLLGLDSGILSEKQLEKLAPADYPDAYKGFVKKWMEALFKSNKKYDPSEAVQMAKDAQEIVGEDPQLWMRVQMLRNMEKAAIEASINSSSRLDEEKILKDAVRTMEKDHELQHAINAIDKLRIPAWMDELSAMIASVHGRSENYPVTPQLAMAGVLPLFSQAFEKFSKIQDLELLDYGERAALLFVCGMEELNKGKTPDLKKIELANGLEAFYELPRMESFELRQLAMKFDDAFYRQVAKS